MTKTIASPGAPGNQPLYIGEAFDRLAVDADEPVPGHETGGGGWAVRHDLGDRRLQHDLAVDRNSTASTAMVNSKLNAGPANTVAARFQIGCVWNATLRSASESDAISASSGWLVAFMSPTNLT